MCQVPPCSVGNYAGGRAGNDALAILAQPIEQLRMNTVSIWL
jgi:hypothetical protein